MATIANHWSHHRFVKNLMAVSRSRDLQEAADEWDFDGVMYLPDIPERCHVCNSQIKNVARLKNRVNGARISIGFTCWEKLVNFLDTGKVESQSINRQTVPGLKKYTRAVIDKTVLGWLYDQEKQQLLPPDIQEIVLTIRKLGMAPTKADADNLVEYYKHNRLLPLTTFVSYRSLRWLRERRRKLFFPDFVTTEYGERIRQILELEKKIREQIEERQLHQRRKRTHNTLWKALEIIRDLEHQYGAIHHTHKEVDPTNGFAVSSYFNFWNEVESCAIIPLTDDLVVRVTESDLSLWDFKGSVPHSGFVLARVSERSAYHSSKGVMSLVKSLSLQASPVSTKLLLGIIEKRLNCEFSHRGILPEQISTADAKRLYFLVESDKETKKKREFLRQQTEKQRRRADALVELENISGEIGAVFPYQGRVPTVHAGTETYTIERYVKDYHLRKAAPEEVLAYISVHVSKNCHRVYILRQEEGRWKKEKAWVEGREPSRSGMFKAKILSEAPETIIFLAEEIESDRLRTISFRLPSKREHGCFVGEVDGKIVIPSRPITVPSEYDCFILGDKGRFYRAWIIEKYQGN